MCGVACRFPTVVRPYADSARSLKSDVTARCPPRHKTHHVTRLRPTSSPRVAGQPLYNRYHSSPRRADGAAFGTRAAVWPLELEQPQLVPSCFNTSHPLSPRSLRLVLPRQRRLLRRHLRRNRRARCGHLETRGSCASLCANTSSFSPQTRPSLSFKLDSIGARRAAMRPPRPSPPQSGAWAWRRERTCAR